MVWRVEVGEHAVVGVEGLLDGAVAGGEDLGEGQGDGADKESANGRFGPGGQAEAAEDDFGLAEEEDVETDGGGDKEGQERVEQELDGRGEGLSGGLEDGLPAKDAGVGHVGDGGGDHGGDEDIAFQVEAAIEDFGGEEGTGHGGTEDGADTCGHTGGEKHAAFVDREVEDTTDQGAAGGTNLGDGALGSGGTTCADDQGRGDNLDGGDGRGNVDVGAVVGRDDGVRAVTTSGGGEAPGDKAREEGTHGREEEGGKAGEKGWDGQLDRVREGDFTVGEGKVRLDEGLEREDADVLDGGEEADGEESGEEADGGGDADNPPHAQGFALGGDPEAQPTP